MSWNPMQIIRKLTHRTMEEPVAFDDSRDKVSTPVDRLQQSETTRSEPVPGFTAYQATMEAVGPLLKNGKYSQVLTMIELLEGKYNVEWHARGLFTKGVALCGLGRNMEALVFLDRCITEHPGEIPEALLNKGLALERLGRFPQSLEAFRVAAAFPATAENANSFKLGLFEHVIRQSRDTERWIVVCCGGCEPPNPPQFTCMHWVKAHWDHPMPDTTATGHGFSLGVQKVRLLTNSWPDLENAFGGLANVQAQICPCCRKPFTSIIRLPLMTSMPLANTFDQLRDLAFFAPFGVLLDGEGNPAMNPQPGQS